MLAPQHAFLLALTIALQVVRTHAQAGAATQTASVPFMVYDDFNDNIFQPS